MNNIQLGTTLVAPTGTGLLYTAYDQGSDLAVWKNDVGVNRSIVSLKRVQAKPTPTFPGTERFNFKRTTYHTVSGVEYVAVCEMVTSIPVPITLADRTAIHLNAAMLYDGAFMKQAIEYGYMPT